MKFGTAIVPGTRSWKERNGETRTKRRKPLALFTHGYCNVFHSPSLNKLLLPTRARQKGRITFQETAILLQIWLRLHKIMLIPLAQLVLALTGLVIFRLGLTSTIKNIYFKSQQVLVRASQCQESPRLISKDPYSPAAILRAVLVVHIGVIINLLSNH